MRSMHCSIGCRLEERYRRGKNRPTILALSHVLVHRAAVSTASRTTARFRQQKTKRHHRRSGRFLVLLPRRVYNGTRGNTETEKVAPPRPLSLSPSNALPLLVDVPRKEGYSINPPRRSLRHSHLADLHDSSNVHLALLEHGVQLLADLHHLWIRARAVCG